MQLGNRERENPPVEPRLFGQPAHSRSALVLPISAARWMLVLILLAGVYFFHGFVVPVLAAVVIGFASWPIYRRLLQALNGNRTLAATIAIISVIAFIVVPISIAAAYAVDEVRDWLVWAVETNVNGAPVPAWLTTIPVAGVWLGQQWVKYVGHPGALGELVQLVSGSNIGNIYRGVLVIGASAFQSFLTLLFMLITLFFVYRDGHSFSKQLDRLGEQIFPMRWERLSRVVPLTISSTVTGMGIIAIGEGIVLGVAYWLAGVPSPVTLGIITGLMALIPGAHRSASPSCRSIWWRAARPSTAWRSSSGVRRSSSSSTRRCVPGSSAARSSCPSCRPFSALSAASRRWVFLVFSSVRC